VKPITDFDAKHLKGGGFRGNSHGSFLYTRQIFGAEGYDASRIIYVKAASSQTLDIYIISILKGHSGNGKTVCGKPCKEGVKIRDVPGICRAGCLPLQLRISLPPACNEIAVSQCFITPGMRHIM
jgi:hypothetical protein